MLTKQVVRQLRETLQIRLDTISIGLGFKLKLGSASFSSFSNTTVNFKLGAIMIDPTTGTAEDPEVVNFKKYANRYGLKPDDLGKSFTFRKRRYEICGLKQRARTAPILCKRDDGKLFKFPAAEVVILLGGTTSFLPAKRTEADILADLKRVENDLSPENLTMDGELRNPRIIRERREALESQKRRLIVELGHTPTDV